MTPFLSNKGDFQNKIILIENDEIISDNKEVAQKLNNFFESAVKSLGIIENQSLLSTSNGIDDPIDRIIKKYEIHPSILAIKDKVKFPLQKFSFSHISLSNMEHEVKSLNGKKSATFQNILAKHLKTTFGICSPKLDEIWKNILIKCTLPNKLKLADITPIFKSVDTTCAKNYRPVSVLPVVSKVFERIMQKQIFSHVEQYLSSYLYGY